MASAQKTASGGRPLDKMRRVQMAASFSQMASTGIGEKDGEVSLSARQQEALAYFRENLGGWLSNPQYKFKYAVIRDNALVGVFDTFGAALAEAAPKYPQVDFIIQQIIPEEDAVEFLFPALV